MISKGAGLVFLAHWQLRVPRSRFMPLHKTLHSFGALPDG